jgi:hypothetical protein
MLQAKRIGILVLYHQRHINKAGKATGHLPSPAVIQIRALEGLGIFMYERY